MKCPHCGNEINIGVLLGSTTSKAKANAARRNAKLGGWPKGRKRGPRDANVIAHAVVRQVEKLTQQAKPPRPPKGQ